MLYMNIVKTLYTKHSLKQISKMSRTVSTLNGIKPDESKQMNDMVGKHLLTLEEFNSTQVENLLWAALDIKKIAKEASFSESQNLTTLLRGLSIAAIFQKRSTRTRFSFEAGAQLLGAHCIFCNKDDIHLGVNESPKDTSIVMSSLADLITGRVYEHSTLTELAEYAKCPVVNALSDLHHPLQSLADLMTIYEHFGRLNGLKLAWVGDGNNVLHSLLIACTKLKMNVSVATPIGYEPDKGIVIFSQKLAQENNTTIELSNSPIKAVQNADIIVTDTWISMGQEAEKLKKINDFAGYQVTLDLLKNANKDWVFLHCLPRKNEEVDDQVFYHKQSLVFQEAENRKWTTMSVLVNLLRGYTPQLILKKPSF